jgi:hypothetical protein
VIRNVDRGRMTVAAAAGLLALRLLKTPTSLSGVDNRWVNYLGQAFITPHGEPIGQKGDPLADDVDTREELQRLTRDGGLRRAQLTGCALNVRLTGASHSWPHVHPRALHPPDSRFPGPGACSSSPRRGSGRGRADRRGVRITYPVCIPPVPWSWPQPFAMTAWRRSRPGVWRPRPDPNFRCIRAPQPDPFHGRRRRWAIRAPQPDPDHGRWRRRGIRAPQDDLAPGRRRRGLGGLRRKAKVSACLKIVGFNPMRDRRLRDALSPSARFVSARSTT